jgi:hypothetical protein
MFDKDGAFVVMKLEQVSLLSRQRLGCNYAEFVLQVAPIVVWTRGSSTSRRTTCQGLSPKVLSGSSAFTKLDMTMHRRACSRRLERLSDRIIGRQGMEVHFEGAEFRIS